MPISAPGSNARGVVGRLERGALSARSVDGCGVRNAVRGFTLIELIVVIAIIALSASLITLSLRDGAQSRLDLEAERLSVLLEGARADARASGLAVSWEPVLNELDAPPHFRFVGLPVPQGPAGALQAPSASSSRWLHNGVRAEVIGAKSLLLGPEPMIGVQRVVLRLDERQAVLATDGLGPFTVVNEEVSAP
jgi:general secretion pathway protein H